MADDPSIRAPQDRTQINVNQDYELRYWTKALGVTADQLKQAVKAVGTSAAKVRQHLGK